jgi:hypothetical protein
MQYAMLYNNKSCSIPPRGHEMKVVHQRGLQISFVITQQLCTPPRTCFLWSGVLQRRGQPQVARPPRGHPAGLGEKAQHRSRRSAERGTELIAGSVLSVLSYCTVPCNQVLLQTVPCTLLYGIVRSTTLQTVQICYLSIFINDCLSNLEIPPLYSTRSAKQSLTTIRVVRVVKQAFDFRLRHQFLR